jgi:hypothetical protein
VPGANTARIATGGALVDGKPYDSDANVDVNIPSAVGGGNTRIDRIVLRASWGAQTVRITRIAGTDAASPTAPAITQTPGTTYDILLYQALVNTSGTVTLTDERTFGQVATNGLADLSVTTAKIGTNQVTAAKLAASGVITGSGQFSAGVVDAAALASNAVTDPKINNGSVLTDKIADLAVTTAKLASGAVLGSKIATGGIDAATAFAAGVVNTAAIANDAVDDTKAGNRVPQFYRRKGGSATDWEASGTTIYTPGAVRMQAGSHQWTGGAAAQGAFSVTFPVAFSALPLVFAMPHSVGAPTDRIVVWREGTGSNSQADFRWADLSGNTHTSVHIAWLAIGPE